LIGSWISPELRAAEVAKFNPELRLKKIPSPKIKMKNIEKIAKNLKLLLSKLPF
jgi:hypothetical protein